MENKRNTKHGEYKSPEYAAWAAMKERCYRKKYHGYINYGGRGILVCARWKDSFESFLLDMGRKPSIKYSLDRIDVNGDYCPENCRWATHKEQANNKNTNRILTYSGRTLNIQGWADIIGVSNRTILSRLRRGWSIEKTLSIPVKKYSN